MTKKNIVSLEFMFKKIKNSTCFLLSSLALATLSVGLCSSPAQAQRKGCEGILLGLRGKAVLTTDWNTGEHFEEKVFISKSSDGSYYIRWNNSSDWFKLNFSGFDFNFKRDSYQQKFVGKCARESGGFGSDGMGVSSYPVVRGSAIEYTKGHTAKFTLSR